MTTLALKTPVDKSWNVTWDAGTYTSNSSGIFVSYPKGQFASSAGAHFRAQPRVFPCTRVTLEYKVFFPSDFDFVKGGKLPGVWGGDPGSGGGNWNDDGWSYRVMWRDGGTAVAYVYMCTDQGEYDGTPDCRLSRNQGKGFDDIAHHTNGTGIDLWRDARPGLTFKRGAWNTVSLSMAMNSPGTSDGLVSLTVNGVTKSFDKLQWCRTPKNKAAEGMMFATWFGGGSQEYAPSKPQNAQFKDFVITRS